MRVSPTGTGGHERFAGGGEMGALTRAKDWSSTPLGPLEGWPQSLKTAVRIMLTSRFAMWMAWGTELTFFCNDAYKPTLGIKQAWALGSPAAKVWAEIWGDIGPRIEAVFRTGEATWDEGLLLFLERSGYAEETYHTFSYSPLADDSGRVTGMLCVVTEETERVIGERRLGLLRDLGAALAGTNTAAEVLATVSGTLEASRRDLPFTLVYRFEDGAARLACSTGMAPGHAAAPASIRLDGADAAWPVAAILGRDGPIIVGELEQRFGALPTGAWTKAPNQAVVVAIAGQGQELPLGFLVAGLNPYRSFDEAYAGFVGLVAGQIASGLANARAYEEERRRAEALAQIDRAKTAFFSNVSHEFRTPLTLMLGPLEDLLGSDGLPEAAALQLETMHRNGLRLLRLVNTLLDFSRVEAGRVDATFEPTDLGRLTAELASSFRSACERAGLALAVECASLPEAVWVDRDMWEKIVLNLLSNAFKFTLDGGIAVELAPTDDGQAVRLLVRDTGLGIPPAELPRVFERFHRIEATEGRTHEGTGIGLALVQELVRLHGGTIAVESTPGRGSTFAVTVPRGHAHLPVDRLRADRGQVSTATRADAFVGEALRWLPDAGAGSDAVRGEHFDGPGLPAGGARARVLVADDNADLRGYVARLLAPAYEVEAVADGEAALASARHEPPDLVLSDVMMPRLDGVGLVRALRSDPRTRDVPIVLLSARAGEEARIEGLDAGADDYLAKPFHGRELVARVRAALELARERRRSAEALRASETRFRVALATAPVLVFSQDLELRYTWVHNPVLGLAAGDLLGRTDADVLDPEEAAPLEALKREVLASGAPARHEVVVTRGATGCFDLHLEPLRDREGRVIGLTGAAIDITERKRNEEQRELLLRELSHRVKNMLALILAIARQTATRALSVTAYGDALGGRLRSLAAAHDLLTASGWHGASLAALARETLRPHLDDAGSRLRLELEDLPLRPDAAQNLALALHELATNAAKYGALSDPGGRVLLVARREPNGGEPMLELVWRESDGPAVQPLVQRGFGMMLLEQVVGRQHRGTVVLDWDSAGLACRIHLPEAEVVSRLGAAPLGIRAS